MARPLKQGIDYFPIEVDFFNNIKTRRIAKACGPGAYSILVCLLCNIYKNEGYYILWDDDVPFFIADSVGVTEGSVEEIVKKALQVGYFDKELFEKYKILTSEEVQSKYLTATERRVNINLNPDFLVNVIRNRVYVLNNSERVNNNPVNDSESTQSKVNKSKDNPPNPLPKGGGKKKRTSKKGIISTLNLEARKLFEDHYQNIYGSSYYWTPKDAGNMTGLLNKLTFQRKEKLMDCSDNEVLNALKVFLSNINEGWIFENFSVSNINSKFNEILSQIKSRHDKSKTTAENHIYD